MAETIYLYGVISNDGYEGSVSSEEIIAALEKHAGKPVDLRVNSPGGSVFEADAIYNAIQRHGNVVAHVDALAASAASYSIQGARKVVLAENATVMVHRARAFGLFGGDIEDVEKWYSEIRQLLTIKDEQISQTYASRSGRPQAFWMEQMAKTTYYTAKEAVAVGLGTEIGQRLKMSACIPLNKETARQLMGNNIPSNIQEDATKESQEILRPYQNYYKAKVLLTSKQSR